jgi:ABC-type nitrate/sulfonate/bicarbonate transport system substrate-binding protein
MNASQLLGGVVRIFLLSISIGSAGEFGCAFAAPQSPPIILQLEGQTDASVAGAIVALKAGLFAREGLAVKIETVGDSNLALEDRFAVVIRLQDAHQVLLDRAKGRPVVAFAGNYIDSSVAFFFRRDRRIRSPDDLPGKSIGYDPHSDSGLIFEWFLDKNPISRSHINEVPSNPGSKRILENTLDVLVGHVGVEDLTFEEAGISIEMLDPRQYGVHALGTVYVTNESAIEKNPDTLVRFLRALSEGWDLTYDKPDEAASMILGPTTAPDKISLLKRALVGQRQFLRPGGGRFGEIPQYKWNELQSFMLQRRLLKSPIGLKRATNATIIAEAYRYQSRP